MGTELLVVGSYALTPLTLSVLLTAGVIGGIGVYPLLSEEPLQESLFFFLLCLSCAVWLVGFAGGYGAPNRTEALQSIRVAYLGVPLIPAALYTVTVHVLGIASERRAILGVAWSLAAAFVVVLAGTDLLFDDVRRYSWGWYPRYTSAGAGFIAFVAGGLGASLREYWLRYRHAPRGHERRQAGLYLVAFGIGSLAVVDFLPCYGVDITPVGFVPILGMSAFLSHTIQHYHLTEITPAFAANHVLERLSDPVVVCNQAGEIEVVNNAAAAGLGYAEEELVGRPLHALIPDSEPGVDTSSRMLTERDVSDEELHLRTRDGSRVPVSVSTSVLTDKNGRRIGTVVVARDITERKELESQLRHRALHDPLTGLPNRTLLTEQVEQALARARRRDHTLGLLMVDIDRFKRVNDNLGHSAGDHVLREVGRRLRESVRGEDTVARWGGDEFVVLLTETEGPEAMNAAVERIRGAVRRPLHVGGESLRLDVSVGGVLRSDTDDQRAVQTDEPEELVRLADLALNTAKEQSPGGVHRFDPVEGDEGHGRLQLEQDLRRGLEAGEVVPHFQPIVSLKDGSPAGVEVLARWRHPERGLVTPGEFIPLAEELGLIGEIGEAVFEEGCSQAAEWIDGSGGEPQRMITFNTSASQLEDRALPDKLNQWLQKAGLPPSRVVLEVTETVLVQATSRLEELKDLGLRVYVDDFGTGYSTFTYLRDLDVDGLKIDMTFVQGLTEDGSDAALVDTILTLADRLDLAVVAEGVETEAQRDKLRELGCELAQGYLFARPMPAEEVFQLLLGQDRQALPGRSPPRAVST